ncbi:trypsin-like serine protease [Pigmentibacter sp. JX0631]|uniref:trypsin-like serine protease n=1 Tax=Pigmentibacter sp. JX0631 TaxID=2976982 RepID=UPI0024694397|nr:trypsin-like serine protease [Pigmentibacter sp. JX0631]WGL58645.1 trypsin-like serine protease [Pigmentibacter sp. JX0631]
MLNKLVMILIILTTYACGKTSDNGLTATSKEFIVNGKEINVNTSVEIEKIIYRSVVPIVVIKNNEYKLCTGTIVSDKYILTASHCLLKMNEISFNNNNSINSIPTVTNDEIFVILNNKVDINNFKINHYKYAEVENFFVNEKSMLAFFEVDSPTHDLAKLKKSIYDLAIIKLKHKIDYDRKTHVNLIPINNGYKLNTNKNIYIAGFGSSYHDAKDINSTKGNLRIANSKITELDKVRKFFKIKGKPFRSIYHPYQLYSGTCYGDSGGPAFTLHKNNLYLVGVLYGAVPNKSNYLCGTEYGSYYMSLTDLEISKWIHDIIGN